MLVPTLCDPLPNLVPPKLLLRWCPHVALFSAGYESSCRRCQGDALWHLNLSVVTHFDL
jgi:hypothetical protein